MTNINPFGVDLTSGKNRTVKTGDTLTDDQGVSLLISGGTGIAGATGVQGVSGSTGISGVTGLVGDTGILGLTGLSNQGATGIQGIDGILQAEAVIDFSVSPTASTLIPAGALQMSVTSRVLTIVSGGGSTGYEVGDGTDVDRWGTIGALTVGTTTDAETAGDNTVSFNNSASTVGVTLTGIGGAPTAGTVRVRIYYMLFAAPTS